MPNPPKEKLYGKGERAEKTAFKTQKERHIMTDFYDNKVVKQLTTECYLAALNGKPFDVGGFPAAEYKYFDKLYKLYSSYDRGNISAAEAEKIKKEYERRYISDRDLCIRDYKLRQRVKELTETADKLCKAITKVTVPLPAEVNSAYAELLVILRKDIEVEI